MDTGMGTVGRLLQLDISIVEIDRVFYTHIHPDHVAELVSILFALNNPNLARNKPIHIYGPFGFRNFLEALTEVYKDWIRPKQYQLLLKEIVEDELTFEEYKVITTPVEHTADYSLAYRVESKEGKAVVFSGDTDYCEALVSIAKGANLLVLECSFPEGQKCYGHLTPSLAGRIATESKTQILLLTHFYPECEGQNIEDECRKSYQGDIIIAHDLMTLVI